MRGGREALVVAARGCDTGACFARLPAPVPPLRGRGDRHSLAASPRAGPAILAIAALAACSPPVTIPDAERQRTARALEGSRLYLAVAVYAAPLFDDVDKLLITDRPLDELELLETPAGTIIDPPPAERVLPPGTPVEVRKVEFPTGWVIASRMIRTPRYHPWVFLALPGEERPAVLVLPQLVANAEEARAEVERLASTRDPRPAYRALPEAQRAAVERKELVKGMAPAAVEMAWGYPRRKVIDRPAGTEVWTWPDDRRRAWFEAGRVIRWERLPPPAS